MTGSLCGFLPAFIKQQTENDVRRSARWAATASQTHLNENLTQSKHLALMYTTSMIPPQISGRDFLKNINTSANYSETFMHTPAIKKTPKQNKLVLKHVSV